MENLIELKKRYIPSCCAGKITIRQTADLIGITMRQVCRLKAAWRQRGDEAFINGHKGMKPKNTFFTREKQRKIISIYEKLWKGCNFAFFLDCLQNNAGINISYTTLRKIMYRNGITSPKCHRPYTPKKHPPRKEKPHEGDLVQLDASSYDWFMTGQKCALHGAIDDATHKIVGLYFCQNECRLGYNEVMRQIIDNHGVPVSCYTDRHASFVANPRTKDRTHEEIIDYNKQSQTHWNALYKELDIESILALSPQGKGRIERLWQTLQGRLPFIFRFQKISSLEAANRFLPGFIDSFNRRFSVLAESPDIAFRPFPGGKNKELLLAIKFPKRTKHDGTFIFHGYRFRLMRPLAACKDFTLCLSESYGIKAYYKHQYYDVKLDEPLCDVVGDQMPAVEKDLIQRYLLQNVHTNIS